MADLTASAMCHGCDWAPEGDDPTSVDRQAAKHAKQLGHATGVTVVPR